MICPACGQTVVDRLHQSTSEALARIAAKALGSLGGRTTGKTKARAVDYAAMARLSHQKRRASF